MASTEDLALEDYARILLVGDSGTHKTFFLGGLPRPYIFDCDKGLNILRGRKGVSYDTFKDAPYGSKRIRPELGIYPWGTAWEKLQDQLNVIGTMMEKGTCPYDSIAIDSLTTLGNIALNYALKNTSNKSSWKAGQPIDQGQWGAQMGLLESLIDQLTAWPINFVVTAHMQRDTNTVTQNVEYLPLITGKLAGKIGVYFRDVLFADIKGEGDAGKLSCTPSGQVCVGPARVRRAFRTTPRLHGRQ